MKLIKILVLTPGFPSDESDVNCIPSLQLFIRELAGREDVEVQIVSTQYPFRFGTYHWHGVKVHACGGANGKSIIRIWTFLKAFGFLLRFGRKADVVQGFWLYECSFIAAVWAWIIGVKSVCTVQGQDSKSGNGFFPLMRRVCNWRHVKVASISQFGADRLLENSEIQTDVLLPCGMDQSGIPTFSPGSERPWDVMGAGSLVPVKNYRRFLSIIALVKEKKPDVKVCLAGGGPEHEMLLARIQELGLEKNVSLLSEIPRDQVLERMTQTKIFLHTSLWEGQGFVLMESLALGMYVVATPVGYLYPSEKSFVLDDNEKMAEKILSILSEKQDFTPIEVLTMSQTADNYLDFYRRP
jgi:glycosyltransferase involved in cell wall biosynthesis